MYNMEVKYIWIMDFCTDTVYKINLEGELLKEANECEDFDKFLDKLFDKLGVKESNISFMISKNDNVEEETYDRW